MASGWWGKRTRWSCLAYAFFLLFLLLLLLLLLLFRILLVPLLPAEYLYRSFFFFFNCMIVSVFYLFY